MRAKPDIAGTEFFIHPLDVLFQVGALDLHAQIANSHIEQLFIGILDPAVGRNPAMARLAGVFSLRPLVVTATPPRIEPWCGRSIFSDS